MATNGNSLLHPWKEELLEQVQKILTTFFNKDDAFSVSADLLCGNACMEFFPHEKKWNDAIYSKKILVTHYSLPPCEQHVNEYGIKHFRLLSSSIAPKLSELIEKITLNQSPRVVHVVADCDDTLLDRQSTLLRNQSILNSDVIKTILALKKTTVEIGLPMSFLAMTSREKLGETASRCWCHPTAMTSMAAAAEQKFNIKPDLDKEATENLPLLLERLSYST